MTLKAMAVGFAAVLALQAQDGLQRERGGETDAAKTALEGKAPPIKLEMDSWANWTGRAPTWETLKGKVVLLDFWAYW
jgi:hypothetical protein